MVRKGPKEVRRTCVPTAFHKLQVTDFHAMLTGISMTEVDAVDSKFNVQTSRVMAAAGATVKALVEERKSHVRTTMP